MLDSSIERYTTGGDGLAPCTIRPGLHRHAVKVPGYGAGSQQYHGDANVIARAAQLNARNAFAIVRPPEQRRIFEGFLGGPVGHGGKTSFTLSAQTDADDQQAVIFAIGPAGSIRDTAPQPNRLSPGPLFDVGVGLSLQSGQPHTETLGQDLFNNGRGTARPSGVSRNSLESAGYVGTLNSPFFGVRT